MMTSLPSAASHGVPAADNPLPALTGPNALPGMAWSYSAVHDGERVAVELFMQERFERAYGARIANFMPTLMALRKNGELLAACGLREAQCESLFLETYLDAPVEAVLAAAIGRRVERAAVVEVGNLAIARPGAARAFIVRLTRYLMEAGRAWTVFSAVPTLRNNFARMGIPVVVLGPADPARLQPGERSAWGSYYDSRPLVSAVSVADAHAALARTA